MKFKKLGLIALFILCTLIAGCTQNKQTHSNEPDHTEFPPSTVAEEPHNTVSESVAESEEIETTITVTTPSSPKITPSESLEPETEPTFEEPSLAPNELPAM